MTAAALGALGFGVLLLLIFARIQIGIAMMLVGIGGSWALYGTPAPILAQLKSLTYGTVSNYSFSIVPLFLLMGEFATRAGMSRALFDAARSFLGHRRGGVAMAAIGACAGFGAICGSSLATAATMGQVALPELRRTGYADRLSTAVLAAGGTLGILIPPSVILVIYAVLTEQNVATLFAAALIPGLLAALGYALVVALIARLTGQAGAPLPPAPWSDRLRALVATWPVALIFGAVVGGIYTGLFSPTEAAAIGAAGTAALAIARGLTGAELRAILLGTAGTTAMIFVIILGAAVFNTFVAGTRIPQAFGAMIEGSTLSPWVVLWAVLALYLVFGCVMDSLSMILLTVPILFPALSQLDFGMTPDAFAIWFGILVLIVVEVGLITPPVGMNLFVINGIARETPIVETFRGVVPFVGADLARVVLLVAFPGIVLGILSI